MEIVNQDDPDWWQVGVITSFSPSPMHEQADGIVMFTVYVRTYVRVCLQACKVFDENAISLPGLIPSMHLQQQ